MSKFFACETMHDIIFVLKLVILYLYRIINIKSINITYLTNFGVSMYYVWDTILVRVRDIRMKKIINTRFKRLII